MERFHLLVRVVDFRSGTFRGGRWRMAEADGVCQVCERKRKE